MSGSDTRDVVPASGELPSSGDTSWFATLEKYGREGEREFFMSAWNGDTGHTIDRIGRGSVYVPHCCVSILGGIPPAKLHAYLSEVLEGGPQTMV